MVWSNQKKTAQKQIRTAQSRRAIRLWAVLFWLLVWEIGSIAIGSRILLVSPIQAALRLFELLPERDFWSAILFSFSRIAGGFFLASAAGVLLAAFAARFRRVEELLAPLMLAAKTIPVASFIILALIWFSSRTLSILISFIMVLPIIYTNVRSGIQAVDSNLLEMAELFRIPFFRRVRYIELPQVLPYFQAACAVSLGLCWKSGIAAEVIGMPEGSIGERLQQAKVYLDTPDLFAWTFVIVVLSLGFEKLMLFLLEKLRTALKRDGMRMQHESLPEAKQKKEKLTESTAAVQCKNESAAGDRRGTQSSIRIRALSKSYQGICVLDALNLEIKKESMTAIMAPSGAGKTTLLRILMGFEEPDSGEITGLSGCRLSAVFQEDRLCQDLTAPLNIRLVNPQHGAAEVESAMEAVGLQHCASKQVQEFSGGMRRRTAILRALLAEYDVLLMDEPFQGLDETTKEAVIRDTRQRVKGKTVILVTHAAEEAHALGAEIIKL